jgi:hypothetical protein
MEKRVEMTEADEETTVRCAAFMEMDVTTYCYWCVREMNRKLQQDSYNEIPDQDQP